MLVLRVNGDKPYHKAMLHKLNPRMPKRLEKAGLISSYNKDFGYLEGDYKSSRFDFEGYKFKIEYFSGCFYPFILMLK